MGTVQIHAECLECTHQKPDMCPGCMFAVDGKPDKREVPDSDDKIPEVCRGCTEQTDGCRATTECGLACEANEQKWEAGVIHNPGGSKIIMEPLRSYHLNNKGLVCSEPPQEPKPDHIGPAVRKVAAVLAGFLTIVFAPVYYTGWLLASWTRVIFGMLYHIGMYTWAPEYRESKEGRPWALTPKGTDKRYSRGRNYSDKQTFTFVSMIIVPIVAVLILGCIAMDAAVERKRMERNNKSEEVKEVIIERTEAL